MKITDFLNEKKNEETKEKLLNLFGGKFIKHTKIEEKELFFNEYSIYETERYLFVKNITIKNKRSVFITTPFVYAIGKGIYNLDTIKSVYIHNINSYVELSADQLSKVKIVSKSEFENTFKNSITSIEDLFKNIIEHTDK